MYSKFRPINDNVLVKLVPKETKTSSGLFLPEQSAVDNQKAAVVCPGNSKQLYVDDMVILKKFAGQELDDEFIVVKEEDILGVL